MPKSFAYDVFLSYSQVDEETVVPLAERLREVGLRVWLDRWEIKPGDSIPLAIQRGVETSRVLVLCMSEAYFQSEWAAAESLSVLFRDPTNKARRFVPLRLDSVEAPDLLNQYLYVDWREPSDEAVRALVSTLREGDPINWGTDSGSSTTSLTPASKDRGRLPTKPRVLEGEGGEVNSVSVSADGSRAVSGSEDGVVRVWDLETGACTAELEGHRDIVLSVSVSPNGANVVSADAFGTVLVWELDRNVYYELKSHDDWVRSVSVSADGSRAVSGGDDGVVRVWDLETGACTAELKGYGVLGVSVSADGSRAVSGSEDGVVRVWDLETGACTAELEGHTGPVRAVSMTPNGSRVVSGSEDGEVRIWDLDIVEGRYTNAKVALVGESGVGKSGLRIRLTEDSWRETESTHGMDVRRLDLPGLADGGIEREVWLWDFAGQPDYRLVHQLYMDETALALVVLDPQRDDPFGPLAHWEKALEVAGRPDAARILVAARCDRGGFTVSDRAVKRYLNDHAYVASVKTAAKSGAGCDDLKSLISEHIDWNRLTDTVTTDLFRTLKDTVLAIRREGAPLLQVSALQQRLRMALPELRFDESELRQVLRLIVGQGLVHLLPFGDFVLLRPELVNDYASAVVRAAREDTDEIGAVTEQDVLDAQISLDGVDRLVETDEKLLLRDLVQLFIDRALCIREGMSLVFPSYFRRDRPESPEPADVVVTYRFDGPIDEIYATLVVRLHYTEAFEKDAFWRYAADFATPGGRLAGIYLDKLDEGRAEIRVHFGEDVPKEIQVAFIRYVHAHLHRKALNIVRVRTHRCECGELLGAERVEKALAKGRDGVRCDECDERVPLIDLIEERFADDDVLRAVREMDAQAKIRLDTESLELILVGQAITVAATAGQIFRPTTLADHGIDGEIEFKDHEGKASGRRVYLQLKSGDSHLRRRKRDGAEVFTIRHPRHATYWTAQPAPVMLVVRTSDDEIRWMDVTAYLKEHGPDTTQLVFNGEPFTPQSVVRLRNKLLPAPDNSF